MGLGFPVTPEQCCKICLLHTYQIYIIYIYAYYMHPDLIFVLKALVAFCDGFEAVLLDFFGRTMMIGWKRQADQQPASWIPRSRRCPLAHPLDQMGN